MGLEEHQYTRFFVYISSVDFGSFAETSRMQDNTRLAKPKEERRISTKQITHRILASRAFAYPYHVFAEL